MTSHHERFSDSFSLTIRESLESTPVDIVVMGPEMNRCGTNNSPAAHLRHHIITKAKQFGASIEPEHKHLEERAEHAQKAGHNLVHYEVHLVKQSHLTILIPASPGSLCELGLFSYLHKFCNKLMIFIDRKFEEDESYIKYGPLVLAANHHAKIHYVDYNDLDGIWKEIKSRIEIIRSSLCSDKTALELGK